MAIVRLADRVGPCPSRIVTETRPVVCAVFAFEGEEVSALGVVCGYGVALSGLWEGDLRRGGEWYIFS